MAKGTEGKVINAKSVTIFSKIKSEKNKRNTCGIGTFPKDKHTKIWLRKQIKASGGSGKNLMTAPFKYHNSRLEKRFSS